MNKSESGGAPRVVLDTNILISSIFWKSGNPHKIVNLSIDKKIQSFTSADIIRELKEVLCEKFLMPEEITQRHAEFIAGYSETVETNISVKIVEKDPDDNKILECAASCKADFIVTGDRHLLNLGSFGKTRIVTARKILEIANFLQNT